MPTPDSLARISQNGYAERRRHQDTVVASDACALQDNIGDFTLTCFDLNSNGHDLLITSATTPRELSAWIFRIRNQA